jgi:dolichol-phosphate mannosyltransferase
VLPCLNERESLPQLICSIEEALSGHDCEIVFVDDGSSDNTWEVISNALGTHPRWQGLRLARRFGHQAALLAGLSAARGRAVISMDADGQHPPDLLPEMIRKWEGGAKVVQMVRQPSPRESRIKRAAARVFYRAFPVLCNVPITRGATDFRLMDRGVAELVLQCSGPVPFLRGLIPWLGCETVQIPYMTRERLAGRTKYPLSRLARLAIDGLLNFSTVPLRLGIWAGLLFAALSFAYLCYVAGVLLFTGDTIPGWGCAAGLLGLLGGVQLFCVGLLGEYLGRLYLANLDRPRYVVAESIQPRERRAGASMSGDDDLPAGAETPVGVAASEPIRDAANVE